MLDEGGREGRRLYAGSMRARVKWNSPLDTENERERSRERR